LTDAAGKLPKIEEVRQREGRDLPWRKYQTTMMVEYYRIPCPKCGLKTERVPPRHESLSTEGLKAYKFLDNPEQLTKFISNGAQFLPPSEGKRLHTSR
jgi:hypothetical protein